MKTSSAAMFLALSISSAMGQEARRVYVGITSGAQLSWQVNSNYSNFEQDYLPGLGWKIGLANLIDLKPQWGLLSGLSVVVDESRTVYQFFDSHEWKNKMRHTWLDANATLLYRPIKRSAFSLVMGVGFSARHVLRSSHFSEMMNLSSGSGSWYQTVQTDRLYTWNYFITPQIGVEFTLPHNSGRLLCLLQYHQGLRELYRPYEPDPSSPFDYAYVQPHHKLLSAGINVSWIWGIKRRSDFRNPND